MANNCENRLVISTSVDPWFFLKKEDWRLKFDCLEEIMKFSDDWWTKWIDEFNTEVSELHDLPKPPEPTPIIIQQGTRRYAVKQKPDFIPYSYRIIESSFDSAWSPPIWYYEKLLKTLKAIDPRTTLHGKYYEPWMWFLWEWVDWIEVTEDSPTIARSEILEKDVAIHSLSEFHLHILDDFLDKTELITLDEAIKQLLEIGTPEALEEIEELKGYS